MSATDGKDRQLSSSISCTYCSKTFSSRNNLFRHLRKKHGLDDEDHSCYASQRERTSASIQARLNFCNRHHDSYYRLQAKAGVFSLDEWKEALESFRKPLPTFFRRTLYPTPSAQAVWEILERSIASRTDPLLLEPSSFFAPNVAFVAKTPMREWPEKLSKQMADAQEVGALHRQELCSMVPAVLLDVQPHHCVLDMCAAPGSKTLQILDLMNASAMSTAKHETIPASLPPGMLVANDANRSRSLVVARRARRHPKVPLIVNSSDARHFPSLRHWGGYKVKFDRILCDVPCDGDGTLRKVSSKDWQAWNVKHHLSLHKLQMRILTRALELVRKGGRVVYSTCSLDPVENEAVVVSAIARMGAKVGGIPGEYRILPPEEYMGKGGRELFRYTKGATNWVVPDPKFSADNPQIYERHDQVPNNLRRKDVLSSMFPPGSKLDASSVRRTMSDEEYKRALKHGDLLPEEEVLRLERMLPNCCRFLPHHMDSGGFFCAIVERAAPGYYAMFSATPVEENCQPLDLHGRIFYPVKSSKHVRDFIRVHSNGQDVRYTGLSTLEAAQAYLKQHSAYVVGKSEAPSPLTIEEREVKDANCDCVRPGSNKREKKNYHVHQPQFTPLFTRPHPSLLAEFIDFFGLLTTVEDAARAGVNRFPAENVVIVGGGAGAVNVTTCIDVFDCGKGNDKRSGTRQNARRDSQRFFQLCLLSKEIQDLYVGGAKFCPMQAGLSLCHVPVPNTSKQGGLSILDDDRESEKDALHSRETTKSSTSSNRAERRGRFGILDESTDFLACCATRRVVSLHPDACVKLLGAFNLELTSEEVRSASQEVGGGFEHAWSSRWGKAGLSDLLSWAPGAVIVTTPLPIPGIQDTRSPHDVFLSCMLRKKSQQAGLSNDRLELLCDERLSCSLRRVLETQKP